jgi:signal transduction histidine kinase
LRSPLGLVAAAARSAAEETRDADVRQRCEVIVRAAERLLRTASELLSLTEAPGEADAETFRPAEIVARLVDDLQRLDVPVVFAASAEATRTRVRGAQAQFEALVQSLVNNALDHGQLTTPVSISVTAEGGRVNVTVRNAIATRKRHRGCGLGLYVCEQLATRLNASLRYGKVAAREYEAGVELPAA